MQRKTLELLLEVTRAGRAVVRACDMETGEEHILDPETDSTPLGLAAAQAVRTDSSSVTVIGERAWFLDVFNPPLELTIIGAVHIAQPLAEIAQIAGYVVKIVDPRSAFANSERFPNLTLVREWPDEALTRAPLGPRSALVVLSHDPKLDDAALGAALRSRCFYIGALGSRKAHAGRLERLKKLGFGDADLKEIHAPIGLLIHSRSPAEIAISIMAEMTMQLRSQNEIKDAVTLANRPDQRP